MKYFKLAFILPILFMATGVQAALYDITRVTIDRIGGGGLIMAEINVYNGQNQLIQKQATPKGQAINPGGYISEAIDGISHDGFNYYHAAAAGEMSLTWSAGQTINSLAIQGYVGGNPWAAHQAAQRYWILKAYNSKGKEVHAFVIDGRNAGRSFASSGELTVPVPAAFFLFAPALLGVIGLRRSARKAKLA